MVTARFVNGQVVAEDRFARFYASDYSEAKNSTRLEGYPGLTAEMDVHQDWNIISGSQIGGNTTVILTRLLNTTDQQDRVVSSGKTRVMWAWAAGNSVGYHAGHRGVSVITFFDTTVQGGQTIGNAAQAFPAYDGTISGAFNNYLIPARTTSYSCQVSLSYHMTTPLFSSQTFTFACCSRSTWVVVRTNTW